jgi:hypothetical protein
MLMLAAETGLARTGREEIGIEAYERSKLQCSMATGWEFIEVFAYA